MTPNPASQPFEILTPLTDPSQVAVVSMSADSRLVPDPVVGDTFVRRRHCQGTLDSVSERFAEWDKEISQVVKANQDVKLAELMLRRHVANARKAGHSWAVIGFALGVTRQAAQQRFGGDEAASD